MKVAIVGLACAMSLSGMVATARADSIVINSAWNSDDATEGESAMAADTLASSLISDDGFRASGASFIQGGIVDVDLHGGANGLIHRSTAAHGHDTDVLLNVVTKAPTAVSPAINAFGPVVASASVSPAVAKASVLLSGAANQSSALVTAVASGNLAVSSTPTSATPEPASLLLFGFGAAGLVGARLRRRSKES